jgi:hypothetical protein
MLVGSFRVVCGSDRTATGEKQLQSEDPHFKIGGCWFLRETGTFSSLSEENKSFGGRTDEGRRWNQYVARLFPFSLPLSFYPLFFPRSSQPTNETFVTC